MLDFIRAIAWAVSQIQNEDVVKVFQQINAFNDIYSNIQSILNTEKEIQGLDPRTAGLNPEVYNKAEIIVKFMIQKISLINSFASQFREEIKRMIKTEASKSKVIEMDFMYWIAWAVYFSNNEHVKNYFEQFPSFENLYKTVLNVAMTRHITNIQRTAPVPFTIPNPPTSFQYPPVHPQPLGQKVQMVYYPVYGFY